MNLYMAYGGTNWGNLAAPVVYTSYGMLIAREKICILANTLPQTTQLR